MALHVNIDTARQLITARVSGELSDADFAAMQRSFETDPEFSRKFHRICDLTDTTDVTASDEVMNQWAEDPIMERSARHAIVVTHPAVMSRVLEFARQSRTYARDVSVFPSFSQAENWIEGSPMPDGR